MGIKISRRVAAGPLQQCCYFAGLLLSCRIQLLQQSALQCRRNIIMPDKSRHRIPMQLQLYQFLTSSDTQNTRRSRKIRVQPTSIAQRADGSTHGSARHRAGRPLTCLKKQEAKRPRSLSVNIAAGRPNAKSHGDAH